MIEAGYEKYKGGVFKVPTFETSSGWLVVAAGQDVANEIRKASEDHFDATQTVIDLLQMDHTFGEDVCKAETYHIDVTRRQLTKNIETLFPEIFDELQTAFNDHLPQTEESVPEKQRNIDDLITRIMFLEFGALHTTTITISDALFNLSVHREHIGPLRAEAEEAIAQYGWSREACNKLVKLDSFMKESSRLAGLNSVYLIRKVQKDFTFSNGVTVPAGYTVGCVSHAAQHDSSLYDNSGEFDGFRFCKTEADVNSTKSMTNPDPKFFLFGSGRHMCPGRYFAVAEIKTLLAYILMNYDFRLPDDSKIIPEGQWFSSQRSAHTTAKIQLRKRRT
ncbi:hypothetical protein EST38_g1432 [Candolleomyces aberdarensis]|uniref:Cytochrome P450 n=1 Tax=Candolleomyces aberdarensis TaxID=2316362 RepID=A0A4Q2DVF4_9AGAR|nr:hypothetical protein EST38_g1432 [Candolleomyces aberdarensis]